MTCTAQVQAVTRLGSARQSDIQRSCMQVDERRNATEEEASQSSGTWQGDRSVGCRVV